MYENAAGETISERELGDRYDDMLDEVHGTVTIAGLEYDTSIVLKNVDPIAYRCGFNDWTDAEGWDEAW